MNKKPLYLPLAGPMLLETPLLNKGSAFSDEERREFNIMGLLPGIVETIEEQTKRAYEQLRSFHNNMDKHIFLRNIQDTNETLYYRLITENLTEIMPLIYTPTVGEACQQFSKIYRRARGLFISYKHRNDINSVLQNATKHNVKIIVVTDGERILGLGDQGMGGMGIPIGKLSLYSGCGGISPAYTLPITLDIGTNNQALREDPLYMGLKHERITGKAYDAFIEEFIQSVKARWPDALLQFEDFAGHNAHRILTQYKDQTCCFNDDIQGTAAVTVGTLLSACKKKGESLKDQIVTFCGAGSAGCGIAEQIIAQMINEGLTDQEARQRIFMINSRGLVVDSMDHLQDFQTLLAKPNALLNDWGINTPTASLQETIAHSKSTILIGVSAVKGLFTQTIVETIAANCEHPIILPLSNPTAKIEATPEEVLRWTNGKALVATGSPFEPVALNDRHIPISQCNNSYIFPGVGLGVIASTATRVTDNMLMASSHALANYSDVVGSDAELEHNHLLPDLEDIRNVSIFIAKAVYQQAMTDGVALKVSEEVMQDRIAENFWTPEYRDYKRTAF